MHTLDLGIHPGCPFLLAACIASLAKFMPWWILLSFPATNCRWERVWVDTELRCFASRPDAILKSELSRDILRLSLGRILLDFFGLAPSVPCTTDKEYHQSQELLIN